MQRAAPPFQVAQLLVQLLPTLIVINQKKNLTHAHLGRDCSTSIRTRAPRPLRKRKEKNRILLYIPMPQKSIIIHQNLSYADLEGLPSSIRT